MLIILLTNNYHTTDGHAQKAYKKSPPVELSKKIESANEFDIKLE